MKIYRNPDKKELDVLLTRATASADGKVRERVVSILEDVRKNGDRALFSLTKEIDGVNLSSVGLLVSGKEFEEASRSVSEELKNALEAAKKNIAAFHSAQKRDEVRVETIPGVECWQKAVPIEKVGLYIPGGTAPLFSTVLMLALPAKIAGCREIILCSPADRSGRIAPEILYAAKMCGVDMVYKIGGAMAVGAMAYGTESVPKVDKIFGPGNSYVTIAKQMVSLFDTAIDMPAGPSEVMVVADSTANPVFVAADLLSQAEHGPDSQVILVTDDVTLAEKTVEEVERQLGVLMRGDIARKALENSRIIVVDDSGKMPFIVNEYAPEHLIVSMDDPEPVVNCVESAGSVFVGHFTPESAGDYASGTNHTLPTNGWARAYSGVNLDSFTKKITYQKISRDGLRAIGRTIETMAGAEGLTAHRNAVTLRLKQL